MCSDTVYGFYNLVRVQATELKIYIISKKREFSWCRNMQIKMVNVAGVFVGSGCLRNDQKELIQIRMDGDDLQKNI